MNILAGQIARDIKQQGLSSVYEPELGRVWPEGGIKRERQIESFAKKHGWRLRHYKDGFVAVFDKDGTTPYWQRSSCCFPTSTTTNRERRRTRPSIFPERTT